MYHHEVTMCMLQLWLNSHYLKQPFPRQIYSILEKAIHTSNYYCDQTFKLLSLNDSDAVDFSYIYNIYELSGFLDLDMKKTPGIFYTGKRFTKEKEKFYPKYLKQVKVAFWLIKTRIFT